MTAIAEWVQGHGVVPGLRDALRPLVWNSAAAAQESEGKGL